MASPDQIRKALMKIMSQPKRPHGESTLQDNLGVPPDDIFDAPGHNIRMSEEAAAKAREAVTGSPDKRKPTSLPDDGPSENLGQEVMGEITGPRERVTRPRLTRMDEMDNLFGEEEARQVEAIRKQLNEQGVKRSRVPTERDRAEVLNAARDQVKLKEVDQMAKRVFDKIEELEQTLVMPETRTAKTGATATGNLTDELVGSLDVATSGIGDANKRLRNFKKEAAQAAARARKSGDVSELTALEDRLTASPKGSKAFVRTAKDVPDPTVEVRQSSKSVLLEALESMLGPKKKNPMIGHNNPPK
jgi:hypothetical protein